MYRTAIRTAIGSVMATMNGMLSPNTSAITVQGNPLPTRAPNRRATWFRIMMLVSAPSANRKGATIWRSKYRLRSLMAYIRYCARQSLLGYKPISDYALAYLSILCPCVRFRHDSPRCRLPWPRCAGLILLPRTAEGQADSVTPRIQASFKIPGPALVSPLPLRLPTGRPGPRIGIDWDSAFAGTIDSARASRIMAFRFRSIYGEAGQTTPRTPDRRAQPRGAGAPFKIRRSDDRRHSPGRDPDGPGPQRTVHARRTARSRFGLPGRVLRPPDR